MRKLTTALLLLIPLAGLSGQQPSTPTAVAEGFVVADDGVRLHYRVEGSGAETVIVPAKLYLHRDFAALAAGRRIVFYDMRGRGRSDRVADSTHITIQWDVRDLEAVRRAVGSDRVSLIGFSYLGLMTMMYAAEHPQRVQRVIQIGSVARRWDTQFPASLMANDPSPVPDSASRAEADRVRRRAESEGESEAHCNRLYTLTRAGLVGDPSLADRVPNVCDSRNEWPAAFMRHLRHHFVGSVQKLDVPWATLQRATMPVLTIHGTRDRNAPFGAGREWATQLPNARLLAVEGAAHMPWIDRPEILQAIDQFLNGSWPAGAVAVR